MLKALEILKDLTSDGLETMFDEMTDSEAREYIIEAMQELEALENRSCRNCKYVFSDTLGFIYCSSPKSPLSSCVFPIHPNFSCNKWEKNES